MVFAAAVLCYAALGAVLGILPDYVPRFCGSREDAEDPDLTSGYWTAVLASVRLSGCCGDRQ